MIFCYSERAKNHLLLQTEAPTPARGTQGHQRCGCMASEFASSYFGSVLLTEIQPSR